MADGTIGTYTPGTLRFEDIERIAKEISAMPKGKWMLVAPDCRYWQDEDIGKIFMVAAREAARNSSLPFGVKGPEHG